MAPVAICDVKTNSAERGAKAPWATPPPSAPTHRARAPSGPFDSPAGGAGLVDPVLDGGASTGSGWGEAASGDPIQLPPAAHVVIAVVTSCVTRWWTVVPVDWQSQRPTVS
jgi:hypothetical protein